MNWREKIENRMRQQIQAEEDRRIHRILNATEITIRLLARSITINWDLVSEYYPGNNSYSFKLVFIGPGMGITVGSSHTKEIIHLGAGDAGDITRAGVLCMGAAYIMCVDSDGEVDREAANRYFETEYASPFWQEFIDETERQRLIASIMTL
jgi:hypothetical protein